MRSGIRSDSRSADITAVSRQLETWARGIDYELLFWNRWMETKGAEWPDDYVVRTSATREIETWLIKGLSLADPADAKILDVGAGPISRLGPHYKGKRLDITAVDPLALFYYALGQKHGLKITTVQGFAEDLCAYFDPETFDLSYCSNALDHSFEPMRGIEEMLVVTKLGGRIVLVHAIDEAEYANYDGFHQWNFTEQSGEFIIWNKQEHHNVSRAFRQWSDIDVAADHEKRYINVTFSKKKPMHIDTLSRVKDRSRTILAAILVYLSRQSEIARNLEIT